MQDERKKHQFKIMLSDGDVRALDLLSDRTGISKSEVVRQLIEMATEHLVAGKLAATVTGRDEEPQLEIIPKTNADHFGRMLAHYGTMLGYRGRLDLFTEFVSVVSEFIQNADMEIDEFMKASREFYELTFKRAKEKVNAQAEGKENS